MPGNGCGKAAYGAEPSGPAIHPNSPGRSRPAARETSVTRLPRCVQIVTEEFVTKIPAAAAGLRRAIGAAQAVTAGDRRQDRLDA